MQLNTFLCLVLSNASLQTKNHAKTEEVIFIFYANINTGLNCTEFNLVKHFYYIYCTALDIRIKKTAIKKSEIRA